MLWQLTDYRVFYDNSMSTLSFLEHESGLKDTSKDGVLIFTFNNFYIPVTLSFLFCINHINLFHINFIFKYVSNIFFQQKDFEEQSVQTRHKNVNLHSADFLTLDRSALYSASCKNNHSRIRLFQIHFENWHTNLLKGIYAMTSVGFPT